MTRRLLVPLALLAVLPACRLKRMEAPALYAPWEEGRTLAYEDPSLPTADAQRASRYQLRVAQGLMDPTRPGLVKITQTTFQNEPYTYMLRLEEGGVELLGEDGKSVAWILPKGFQEGTASWTDARRNLIFRVLGPGAWENPARVNGVSDPIGLWLEVSGPTGKRRTLFLRGLGEVETQVWRDGKWVVVNRLVDMGFLDDRPAAKP